MNIAQLFQIAFVSIKHEFGTEILINLAGLKHKSLEKKLCLLKFTRTPF